jgi:hypothetical protein
LFKVPQELQRKVAVSGATGDMTGIINRMHADSVTTVFTLIYGWTKSDFLDAIEKFYQSPQDYGYGLMAIFWILLFLVVFGVIELFSGKTDQQQHLTARLREFEQDYDLPNILHTLQELKRTNMAVSIERRERQKKVLLVSLQALVCAFLFEFVILTKDLERFDGVVKMHSLLHGATHLKGPSETYFTTVLDTIAKTSQYYLQALHQLFSAGKNESDHAEAGFEELSADKQPSIFGSMADGVEFLNSKLSEWSFSATPNENPYDGVMKFDDTADENAFTAFLEQTHNELYPTKTFRRTFIATEALHRRKIALAWFYHERRNLQDGTSHLPNALKAFVLFVASASCLFFLKPRENTPTQLETEKEILLRVHMTALGQALAECRDKIDQFETTALYIKAKKLSEEGKQNISDATISTILECAEELTNTIRQLKSTLRQH